MDDRILKLQGKKGLDIGWSNALIFRCEPITGVVPQWLARGSSTMVARSTVALLWVLWSRGPVWLPHPTSYETQASKRACTHILGTQNSLSVLIFTIACSPRPRCGGLGRRGWSEYRCVSAVPFILQSGARARAWKGGGLSYSSESTTPSHYLLCLETPRHLRSLIKLDFPEPREDIFSQVRW
jgi:hypothetical protein